MCVWNVWLCVSWCGVQVCVVCVCMLQSRGLTHVRQYSTTKLYCSPKIPFLVPYIFLKGSRLFVLDLDLYSLEFENGFQLLGHLFDPHHFPGWLCHESSFPAGVMAQM